MRSKLAIQLGLFSVVLFFSFSVNGQTVKGRMVDLIDGKPLVAATLELSAFKDSTKKSNSTSDSRGEFLFSDIGLGDFYFKASFLGYEDYKRLIHVTDSMPSLNLDSIFMTKKTTELNTVVVVSKTPPAQQKGDTLQLNASQFKVNPDATVEDLVKKMPGITVDRDGTVTAQGEQVKKITIDGRDFFGDDASMALRNLPSDIVDKIQVFDRLSDQAQLTGYDDGNSQKAINIVTKTGMKNGQFGRLFAGAGTDGRYQAGGNVSFFSNNQRISLVGLTNNINQQNFSSQDLLGLTNSGGAGGRSNFGGGTNNFLIGQQSGIAKTNAIGINYSDKWGKKIDLSGSYFFNNSNNNNNSRSATQSFIKKDSTLFFNDTSTNSSQNFNHRFNFRFEYRFDSSNSLSITPSLSFQKNNAAAFENNSNAYSDTNGGLQSIASNLNSSKNFGYNFNNNILYRHSFAKRGRSISLNIGTGFNNKTRDAYQQSVSNYYNGRNDNDSINQYAASKTSGSSFSFNVNYTEPLSKTSQLQITYNPIFNNNKADKQTYQFNTVDNKYQDLDSILSNIFDNDYNTQNAGISFRMGDQNNRFSVGANYQYSKLHSDQSLPFVALVKRNFSNILPSFQFRRKLSARSNIRIFYRASVNSPSISQLQNVIDRRNPLRLTTGNESLLQQYTHVLSGRYLFTNTQKGQSFIANLFLQKTNNYVASATYTAFKDSVIAPEIVLYKGSQISKPVNLNGYWSVRSLITYSQPVKFIKSNINVNAGVSYSRLPGLINNISTFSNSLNYNGSIGVGSNINEYVDFFVSYNVGYNVVKNTLQQSLSNQNFLTQSIAVQLNLLSKNGWFIRNDVSNQSNSGLSSGYNQSFLLWNAGIGKKFLKNRVGELRLSVFDLLKQNQSISRQIDAGSVTDIQQLVLTQYFMLTFTYNLKNFGSKKQSTETPARRGEGRRF